MFDLPLVQYLLRLLAMIIVVAVHGLALAGIARLLGDKGPQYDGRLTINPFVHLDLIGLVSALGSRCGWIKPIAIDPRELRFGRLGLVLCVVLSLAITVLVAWLLLQLRLIIVVTLDPGAALMTSNMLVYLMEMAVYFALFNLLPLPPLTGGHLLAAVAPGLVRVLERYTLWIGLGIATIMVVTGGKFLQPVLNPVLKALGA